jgi:hypothetical protein
LFLRLLSADSKPFRDPNVVACEGCGITEDARAKSAFEPCGALSDGRGSVRRCRNCGTAIVVGRRRLLPGYRTRQIDAKLSAKLQRLWRRDEEPLRAENAAARPDDDDIGLLLERLDAGACSEETMVHMLMEALEISRDEARSTVAAALRSRHA